MAGYGFSKNDPIRIKCPDCVIEDIAITPSLVVPDFACCHNCSSWFIPHLVKDRWYSWKTILDDITCSKYIGYPYIWDKDSQIYVGKPLLSKAVDDAPKEITKKE